jgi:hypothetical protein
MHSSSSHLSTLVEIAADLRRRARLYNPPFSTKRIIAACFPDVLVTGGRLPDGLEAVISKQADGPLIVYQRSLPILEQRYAIAHELGHLVLGDLENERVRKRATRPSQPHVEKRADDFATELLAPLVLVAKYAVLGPAEDPEDHEIYLDHCDDLASIFQVPPRIIDSQIRRLQRHARMTNKSD